MTIPCVFKIEKKKEKSNEIDCLKILQKHCLITGWLFNRVNGMLVGFLLKCFPSASIIWWMHDRSAIINPDGWKSITMFLLKEKNGDKSEDISWLDDATLPFALTRCVTYETFLFRANGFFLFRMHNKITQNYRKVKGKLAASNRQSQKRESRADVSSKSTS